MSLQLIIYPPHACTYLPVDGARTNQITFFYTMKREDKMRCDIHKSAFFIHKFKPMDYI